MSAASRLFRSDGQSATGIDRVMAEAGLTHGGFYVHFRGKAALFAETLEHAFDEAEANLLDRGLSDLRGSAYVEAATARYLSVSHRNQPGAGCAIPALGAEVARAGAPVRRTFARRTHQMIDKIAARLGGARATERATQLLSFWAGTLLVVRGLPESEARQMLSSAGRAARAIAAE